MSDKNPLAKSIAYAEKHDLASKITLDENFQIKLTDDYYESTVLLDTGITLDQVKKLQKADAELYTATVYVAGQKAVDAMKENANLVETGFSYNIGSTVKASGMFHREGPEHFVGAIEHVHRNAEFNRVATSLKSLFNDINN